MSKSPNTPFGILSLCALIGLAIGIMVAKQKHSVSGIIFGPIVGLLVGIIIDRWSSNKK